MDIGTHALASLALCRAIFPRAPKLLWAWAVPAGVLADFDQLSAMVSPAAYLQWYRTYTHSVVFSVILAAVLTGVYRFTIPADSRQRLPAPTIFFAVLLTQWLHLAMDAAQWQGTELFWPFNRAHVAFDWLPTIDPWILTILIPAIVLPEFMHLVSAEIGAKDRLPRGFVAAIIGLALIALYVGLRADLHSIAIAQLRNRTYVKESPRKVAAYSELTSLVSWRAVTETESALHELTVRVNSTRPSSFDLGTNLFKPEPGPILDAAQATVSAQQFLAVAHFPKATVQKMDSGFEVQIRDVRYDAARETAHEPMVLVDFNAAGQLTLEEVTWATADTPR
jgi:inner membrane protein